MKKRLLTLLLCFVMLISCLGAGIDAVTEESGTEPFADETPVADVPSAPVDDITGGAEPTLSLYEKLMSAETEEEFEAIAQAADEDELAALSEEELAALEEHYGEISVSNSGDEDTPISKANNYDDVAMYKELFAEKARPMKAARFALKAQANNETDGLVISKNVTANKDGSYTITLDAFVTGNVSVSSEVKPCDIILVLDRSTSMSEKFSSESYEYTPVYSLDKSKTYYLENGTEVEWCNNCNAWTSGCWGYYYHRQGTVYTPKTSEDSSTGKQFYTRTTVAAMNRMEALKQAAIGFVDEVSARSENNRIAVVSFGQDAKIHTGSSNATALVDVSTNSSAIKTAINSISASDYATEHGKGMLLAKEIFDANSSSTNQRIVIMITDGEPAPNGTDNWSCRVVKQTLDNSFELKNDYSAAVYCISVMPGTDAANPTSSMDKYMSYVSSNYPAAQYTGTLQDDKKNSGNSYYSGDESKIIAQITPGTMADISGGSFYLSAGDTSTLNSIFKQIATQTGGTSVKLNSSAVVKDTVTEYFNMPANTSAVSVKTYDCTSYNTATGAAVWSSTGTALNDAVSIDQANNAVNVTGFDFAKNFVAEKGRDENDVNKTGTFHGRKLVIEFTVTPKAGFLGGNDVPTNGSDSGIYESASAENAVGSFTVPTVNVPVAQPDVSVNNKTVYEGDSTDASGLYNAQSFTWQDDFVDVVYAIDGKPVSGTLTPADCTGYEVSLTYKPKTDGSASQGTPNSMDGVTDTETATIHVLKPAVSVTMNDTVKFYGESCTPGEGNNIRGTVEWKDAEHAAIPAAEGTAPYTAGDLVFTYDKGEFTVPKSDTEINVTVTAKGTDITDKTSFTVSCTDGCDVRREGKYIVHAKTCSLTVQKQGGTDGEPYVFSIMKDGKYYTSVTVIGNGAVTVKELPVGTYSIAEDMNWAWRFAKSVLDKGSVTLGADNVSDTIICTNSDRSDSWLNGFSDVIENVFGKSPVFRAVL